MAIDPTSMAVLFPALLAIVSAWFWYDKKNDRQDINKVKEKVNALENKQTEQEAKFVTEQRTRDIIKEEIQPIKEDVAEIKTNTANIHNDIQNLAIQMRVTNAVNQALKENKDSTN